jgi:phosphoglycolate phosphatase-like HAD superfamily hydrolase
MTLDTPRIRGLCFDIDGTLSDSDEQVVAKLAHFLKPLRFLFKGKNESKAARRIIMAVETPGNWFVSLPDRLGIDNVLAPMTDFIVRHLLTPGPSPHLIIPGVIEMLEALAPRFPMSIVSARDQRSAVRFLDAFDLQRFFPVIATARTCAHTKPFPDPVLWAAAQMGLPPESCLMIGDTVVDIRAGRAAGAQTVGVKCGFGMPEELLRAGADLILDSTADLANVLGT